MRKDLQFEGESASPEKLNASLNIDKFDDTDIRKATYVWFSEVEQLLRDTLEDEDFSKITVILNFLDIDKQEFELTGTFRMQLIVEHPNEAVGMEAFDHVLAFTKLRPKLLNKSLLGAPEKLHKGPITEIVFLRYLDTVKQTTELVERAASGHYLRFAFQPSYFRHLKKYTEQHIGKWEDKKYEGAATALTWDFQTGTGRKTEIVLGRDSVEVRTEVGSVGDVLDDKVDRSFSDLEEPEVAVLKRQADRTKSVPKSTSDTPVPKELNVGEIINKRAAFIEKYERRRFADWKWHKWLLNQCEATYGHDQDIIDKVNGVVAAYWPFNSRDGKRVKEIYTHKHAIRFYFAKYEGIDYLSEPNAVQGYLDFSNGRKINRKQWREIFDRHRRKDNTGYALIIIGFVLFLALWAALLAVLNS